MDRDDIKVIELSMKQLVILAVACIGLVASAFWYIETLRPVISVSADKPEYVPGDVVIIQGVLTGGGSAMTGADLAIEVEGPKSRIVWVDQVRTGQEGKYSSSFRLSKDAPVGQYNVYVSGSAAKGATSFSVGNPR